MCFIVSTFSQPIQVLSFLRQCLRERIYAQAHTDGTVFTIKHVLRP